MLDNKDISVTQPVMKRHLSLEEKVDVFRNLLRKDISALQNIPSTEPLVSCCSFNAQMPRLSTSGFVLHGMCGKKSHKNEKKFAVTKKLHIFAIPNERKGTSSLENNFFS